MKFIRIEKELIIDHGQKYERTLKVGKSYLFSDMRTQQLSYSHSQNIGAISNIELYYNQYKGHDLTNKTILIWRHGGLGDLLFMMPPIRLLKIKYPKCKIIMAVGSAFIDAYMNVPYIDVLMPMPISLETLRDAEYHLHFEGTIEDDDDALRMNAYDLFFERYGIKSDKIKPNEKRPDIFLTDKETREAKEYAESNGLAGTTTTIGIQIAASSPIRTFPLDKINTLSEELVRRGCKVVLFGGPKQLLSGRNIVNSVDGITKTEGMIINVAADNFSFRQSMALTGYMDIIIASDSAMIHVAGALGIPVLGLYGPFPSTLRMKYYYNAIGLNASTACSPCFMHGHDPCPKGNPSPCFSTIGIDTILISCDYLLRKTNKPGLSDISRYKHSEFHKVYDECVQYMKGNGADLGAGFTRYPENVTIERIDQNPLVEPTIIADYTDLEHNKEADFLVSSFCLNTVIELGNFVQIARIFLKDNGYLILYVGDHQIVSKLEVTTGRLKPIKDFYASMLTQDLVKGSFLRDGWKLILEKADKDTWDKEMFFDKEPELLKYGFLSIWQKKAQRTSELSND